MAFCCLFFSYVSYEDILPPMLLYSVETILCNKRYTYKVNSSLMDNLRDALGVGEIYIARNERIDERCGGT